MTSDSLQSFAPFDPGIALVAALVICLIGVVAGVIAVYRRTHRIVKDVRHVKSEEELKAQVAKKAELATIDNQQIVDDELSQSGVFSLAQLIDRNIAKGDYSEAARWAKHAISTAPDRSELQVKLAEIYYRDNDKDEFLQLASTLSSQLRTPRPELWSDVCVMGRELAPDHPLFSVNGPQLKVVAAA